MKIQYILLAGSLLPMGTNYAQVPAALGSRPATAAPESIATVVASLPCVARPTQVRPAWRALPHPGRSGTFTVQLPAGAPRTSLRLELVNVLGSVVLRQELPMAAQFTVPAKGVPVGLYWVRLRGPQGYQLTQRVVLS